MKGESRGKRDIGFAQRKEGKRESLFLNVSRPFALFRLRYVLSGSSRGRGRGIQE